MTFYLENKFGFREFSPRVFAEKVDLSHKLMHLRGWKLPVPQAGTWESQKSSFRHVKLLEMEIPFWKFTWHGIS